MREDSDFSLASTFAFCPNTTMKRTYSCTVYLLKYIHM